MEGIKKNTDGSNFVIMPSFWLLVLLCLFMRCFGLLGFYTISVLIHEFAHFFVAKKLKYKCFKIQLSVFGAVLYGDFDEIEASDSIKIALAGPLANIVVCCLVVASWWIFPSWYVFTQDLVLCNLVLFATNLLPCFPLDGGRIFVALFSRNKGTKFAIKLSRILSIVFASLFFALFAIGFLYGQNLFSTGLFAVFLLLSSANESKKAYYARQSIFDGYKKGIKRGLEKKCLVFDGNCTLFALTKKMKDNYFYEITVLLENGKHFILLHPQINACLLACPLDTQLKNLIKYKI